MDIRFDTQEMRLLVGEAILASLDANKREMLIQSALNHLLTKSVDGYGREPPIVQAFNWAAQQLAQETAKEMLTNNSEFKSALDGLLLDAIKLITETERDKTVARIADAIITGMSRR